jgi:multisubunit Na+/H+ antiporter MnhF subunit
MNWPSFACDPYNANGDLEINFNLESGRFIYQSRQVGTLYVYLNPPLKPMKSKLPLLAVAAAVGSTSLFAQTTYDVATSFTNGALWTANSTWNPATGTPGSLDTITVAAATVFTNGNNINVNGVSRDVAAINYLNNTNGLAFTQTGAITGLSVNVSGDLIKDGTNASSTLAFVNIGLGGAGGVTIRNGGVIFTSSNAAGGANLSTFDLAKNVTFDGTSVGRVPELTIRSASTTAGVNGTLNVNGTVTFGNTTATRVATFDARASANKSSTMNLNGNLTGSIADREVTFKVNTAAGVADTGRQTFSIGGSGTTNYTASAGSKFVVGRLQNANSNAVVDLINARVGGFGAVDTIQLGDGNTALTAGTADVRLLTSVSDTIVNKVTTVTYTGITTGTQKFTVGGTHASGLATYSGAFTLGTGTNLTLLANTANAVTAYTGAFSVGANAVSVTGAGITAMNNTITGTSTLTVASGGTLTPGANGTDVGTLTFAGGQDLAFASGSNALLQVASNASFDRVVGVDALNFGGTATVNFTSTLTGNSVVIDLFSSTSTTGTFDSISVAGTYAATLNAANSYSALDASGNTFAFNHATGDLSFTAAAIPEPSSFAVIAGLVTLGFIGFSRRRHSAA